MALKAIMLRRDIERKRAALEALTEKTAEFETREAELAAAIEETETDEQRDALAEEVETFETEHAAHNEAVQNLTREIEELEGQLQEEERKTPKLSTPEKKTERRNVNMNTINVRALPMNQRAFDAIPAEQRSMILSQDDTKAFLTELRSMKGQTRAISGGELTIPVYFLDLISENMYRYSKLLNRVRVRTVSGEARQTIAGTVPEAIWTEMCGNINELTFVFNQVSLDGYKVAGYIPVCNSLLEDSDVNLASWIVEMLSEAIGLAMDKAILYGKGSAYHMPTGIVTRLAQESKPDSYPANGPEWVDLHTSNIISIDGSYTGASFWSALTLAAANTFTRYARGNQFWAMNSKTYAKLKSKVITFTASGDIAANVFGTLPIINGDIDILEFMPDDNIVGGYGDLYLLAQRSGMSIEASREVQFLQDNTVFRGKQRADGVPVVAGAFVAINIAGGDVVTEMTFAGDEANTVSGLVMGAATASVTVGGTVQLNAVPLPFGVKGDVTWTSGTPANATVSDGGVVTGVKAGTSVITAACNGFTSTCTVTVSAS